MPKFKINDSVAWSNGNTRLTNPSLVLTKGTDKFYYPLLTKEQPQKVLLNTKYLVSKTALKIAKEDKVYCPVTLDEELQLTATLTFLYKAGYNQQSSYWNENVGYSYCCGSYGSCSSTCHGTRTENVIHYRRQTISYIYVKSLANSNKQTSIVITSATCNGANVLNTWGSPRDSWTGWQSYSAPAYPSFTETAPIVLKYNIVANGIVVKSGSLSVAISVPINSGTERSATSTVNVL